MITPADVSRVAHLAKLDLTEEELSKFVPQFQKIVGFVEKISELDTGKAAPMTHAVEKRNVVREDAVKPSLPNETIGKNAPAFDEGSIIVPKIIEI